MRYKQCLRCQEMFMMEEDLCASCNQEMREDFLIVKEYLQDHPGAGVPIVSAETKIPEEYILFMLDQGWLNANHESIEGEYLRCRMCGTATTNPLRLCPKCMDLTQSSLQNIIRQRSGAEKKHRNMVTRDR